MLLQGYDPLGSLAKQEDIVSKILLESQKRDVLNILRSYTGTLDIFSEAIQNSIDAVDQRLRNSNGYEPKIYITIDMSRNSVRVTDNGVGMSLDEIKLFLRPNVSFKSGQNLRGHKGVGATFLAYGYTSFLVSTKNDVGTIAASLSGGRQWADSTTENIPRPSFVDTSFEAPELDHEESGTSIEVTIGAHRDERPNLNWMNITDAATWLKLLRLRTPLGGVYLKTGGIKPIYVIKIIDQHGISNEITATAQDAEFYYPHTFDVCSRNKDITEIQKKVDQLSLGRKEMSSKLPADFRNLDSIWNIWSQDSILDEDRGFKDELSEEQQNLIVKHDVHAYGCFVRSRTVWDTFQKDEMGIRPQFRVIQGGLQLASDFMVQGDLSTIPLTSAAGYQANSFIIIAFTNGNPDMGRKVFQPELKEIADTLSRRIVADLRRYQSLLKPDTGAPSANSSKDLDDWRDDQRLWQKQNPLRLEIKGRDLELISTPREEQDVIALYHQLVGHGFFRGLKFFSTGYNTRYDGLFFWRYTKEHCYERENNFFGIDPNYRDNESGSAVVEYKYSMDGLVRDFEKDEKSYKDINLLVCWGIGTEYKKMFDIISYLVGEEGGTREYFGATHAAFIGSGRAVKVFEIVALKDIVEYLQDPKTVIAAHQTAYG